MESIEKPTFSGIRPGEAPGILNLISSCELETKDITPKMLKDIMVARKGGDILGVVGLEIYGPYALLRSLAVRQGHRQKGIGLRLVEAIERYALSRKVEDIFLLTMTAESFFTKSGYHNIDRKSAPDTMQATREFTDLCPESAVCMYKNISRK